MRRLVTISVFAIAVLLAAAATPSWAQLLPGGHDETSENLNLTWSTGIPTPGVVSGVGSADHLLISEFVVTPTGGEYIEICNSTTEPVDLSHYYVSDDWYTGATPPSCYCNLPAGGYLVTVSSDYTAHFPMGAMINPGQVITVASSGADFLTTYGISPDYELNPTDATVPDMVVVSNNLPLSLALLTNSSEFIVLFYWDGMSDNVCDVDYVQWGSQASGNAVDKTNIAVDGPDADAIPTNYLADTPPGSQVFVSSPAFGSSSARSDCSEAVETTPGNGCKDHVTPAQRATWGKLKVLYR